MDGVKGTAADGTARTDFPHSTGPGILVDGGSAPPRLYSIETPTETRLTFREPRFSSRKILKSPLTIPTKPIEILHYDFQKM